MVNPSPKIPNVTKQELLQLATKTFQECQELLAQKNDDYSTRSQTENALANFLIIEVYKLTSTEIGLFVRLSDKITRISNFLRTGILSVLDEKIDDTIKDAINYLIILRAIIVDKHK